MKRLFIKKYLAATLQEFFKKINTASACKTAIG